MRQEVASLIQERIHASLVQERILSQVTSDLVGASSWSCQLYHDCL
jgi:hypothetical protein